MVGSNSPIAVAQKMLPMRGSTGNMEGHVKVKTMSYNSSDEEDHARAEDTEVGDQETEAPPLTHNKQRGQQSKVAFDDWFLKKAATTDVSKVKVSRKSEKEQLQSLQDMLLTQQAGHMIIGSEREYQIDLFERAKERNTLAVLDTGSGKTLIAVLLLKYVLEREIERRAAGKRRKLAFFLVGPFRPVIKLTSLRQAG